MTILYIKGKPFLIVLIEISLIDDCEKSAGKGDIMDETEKDKMHKDISDAICRALDKLVAPITPRWCS